MQSPFGTRVRYRLLELFLDARCVYGRSQDKIHRRRATLPQTLVCLPKA